MREILEKIKEWNWLYTFYREIRILKSNRKNLSAFAKQSFEENIHEHGSLRDYKKELIKHQFSYFEYFTYRFYHLNKVKRSEYLSEMELKCIYRKTQSADVIKWFDNKLLMHVKFQKYMRRKWLCPSKASFDNFCEFINTNDCIFKPWRGSLGNGVFLLKKGESSDKRELYDRCLNEKLIVEERVRCCNTMEEFHPQSLNTVRVMSMSKGDNFGIIGCVFRMGTGENVVDNGAKNGILAPINPETGLVIGDGINEKEQVFVSHPDTGKVIKGFVIPHWDKVITACKEMASIMPEAVFAGWDLCVHENGEIELIEVNSNPHIMIQQIAYGRGLLPKIQELSNELFGYNLLKLISVWSKPCINYIEKVRYLKRVRDVDNLEFKEYIENSM